MALALITVKASYVDIVAGTVTFTPTEFRADTVGGKIYPAAARPCRVTDTGDMSIDLYGSDVAVEPPFSYQVDEVLEDPVGKILRRSYLIELPVATSGSTVNLAELQPDGTWDVGTVEPGPGFGGSGATGGF